MTTGRKKSVLVAAIIIALLAVACIGVSYPVSAASSVPETSMKTSFRRLTDEGGLTTEVDVAPSVNPGTERSRTGFYLKLNHYQLTGVAYDPGAPFTVTVEAGQGVPTPSLVFAQNWYQSGESSYNTVKLRSGKNLISAPSDSEPGVLYIANDYNVSVKVTIEGGYTYPVYIKGQTDLADFKAEVSSRYAQIREGNTDSMIAYPDIVNLVSDRNLITSTVTGAQRVFVEEGEDPGQTLKNYDDVLNYMYELAGFDNSNDINRVPTNRMHTRANDVPMPFHAASGYIMLTGASSQYNVLYPGTPFGWGLLHEMGHVVENASIAYPETTNNYYVIRTLEHFNVSGANRLTAEGRYNTLFGEFSSQRQLQFQRSTITADTIHDIGNWSRLVMMEQLEMYFNKHYPEKGSFYGNITKEARNHPLSGVGFQEYNFNDIVVHAANVYGVDIRNHFKIQGMDYAVSYQTEKKLGEINRVTPLKTLPTYLKYMNASYASYQGSGFDGSVTAEITEVTEQGAKNLISIGGFESDALAGYEVYRKSGSNDSVYIGFTQSRTFLDVKPTKEAEYTYFALPISKALTAGTLSEGVKFRRSENASLADIQLTAIQYDTMTAMLTVTGSGYDGANTMKVTVNGVQYTHGDLSGSSYAKFVNLGKGEWQMRITNYSAEGVYSLSVFAELMKQKADNVDDDTLIWETVRQSDTVDNTLFEISTRETSSNLLKAITFLSDDTARLDAPIKGVYDLTDDSRRLDTEFDALTYSYSVRRASRVAVDVWEEPETVISFRPVAADEHALVQIKIDGVLQSDNAVRIVTDRTKSAVYVVTVIVTGDYGKAADSKTYTFTIDCPSEDSRAYNVDIEGKASNKAVLRINSLAPDNSVTGTRADGFKATDKLTATVDLTDKSASFQFFAFIGGNYKNLVDEGMDISQVSPLAIQTPQHDGGIVLVVTAADGVTQSFYPIYAALPADWATVADLRALSVKNGYEVGREEIDGTTVISVAYTSTSTADLDVQITPYYGNTGTKKATVQVQSDDFTLSAELGITIPRADFDKFAKQPILFTITSADGSKQSKYALKMVDSDEISMDLYSRQTTGFTGRTRIYEFASYQPGNTEYLEEFNPSVSRYIFAPENESADMSFRVPYSPYEFKAAFSIGDGEFVKLDNAQNGYYTVTVPAGTQRVRLRLSSPSGNKAQTYTFMRYLSGDSSLTELAQTAGELVSTDAEGNVISEFSKDVTDYTVYTDNPDGFSLTQLTGLVTGNSGAKLTVSIDGVVTDALNGSIKTAAKSMPKSVSARVVEIEVKAANGTTTVYRFDLRQKAAADFSALEELIKAAGYKKQSHYSAGFEELQQTLQQAQALLGETNVLQEYVDEMISKVSAAEGGLVTVKEYASLAALGDRIAIAERIGNDEGVYTEASYVAFVKALEEAKAAYASDNASEAASAVERLNAARTALKVVGLEPVTGGGGNKALTVWLIVGISVGVAVIAGATACYFLLKKKRLSAVKRK